MHIQPNKAATTKVSEDEPAKVREPSAVPAVGGHQGHEQSLNLGTVGNCTIAALIDRSARMVWCCYPRVDSDTIFDDLINRSDGRDGSFAVELQHQVQCKQTYRRNTAILSTRLTDRNGGEVEIIDFAPRFKANERLVRPPVLVRRLVPLSGSPRITLRVRPHAAFANESFASTVGSNHVSYHRNGLSFRITSESSVSYLAEEIPFVLTEPVDLILGADHYLSESVEEQAREFLEKTEEYWLDWSRYLSIPFEWQDVVIRAAITLKLCSFEETGAIIAALTTSIPEAPDTVRNWDYRYCWLRDAYFVVNALNQLGTTKTMEEFIAFITNVAALENDRQLSPVYGIVPGHRLIERELPHLTGYRGTKPVRIGNGADRQVQNDVYGSAVLAATQMFFDERLPKQGDQALFRRLERLGEVAANVAFNADASLWELRGSSGVNTYTSAMCWAACDRLSAIASQLGLHDRTEYWSAKAKPIRERVLHEGWNSKTGTFVATLKGNGLDASLLLLHEIGLVSADDKRFIATVESVGAALKRGHHLMRYTKPDDFGWPKTAFTVCTFWYVDALVAIGRRDEARTIFEAVLACRNHVGLLSEDVDPDTGELWGNFPQSYSMVGLINSAMKLSKPWNTALLRIRD
ncbi:glycoside hydrolase family 15 protein [Ancylobacter dichloromethanicus]|uniref:Glucoamylase n=1 Tax=Ancylobacter dichloromethanicus TaxID=518825 RepID=A0A9W6N0G8_9HYPH|nr:glycoside hydrolase family 15 protein [Ancylobacter dichloromethanicus]GLK73779.1 glucoamylase [Ancylobacter dichloromethanicus]